MEVHLKRKAGSLGDDYGGFKINALFDFDDNVVIPGILSYFVPAIFVISNVLIFIGVVLNAVPITIGTTDGIEPSTSMVLT